MASKTRPRPIPAEIDPLIHERLRLGILCALSVQESLTFTELRELLQTTDGNLSVQARKLEDAGYIDCDKRFEDRKPKSTYRLTPAGRKALRDYVEKLSSLLPDLDRVRSHRISMRPQTDALPSKG